jgi:hypothetical protein
VLQFHEVRQYIPFEIEQQRMLLCSITTGKIQKSLPSIDSKGGMGKTICSVAIAVQLAAVTCRNSAHYF